jgi:hypothetical protein
MTITTNYTILMDDIFFNKDYYKMKQLALRVFDRKF